MKSVFITGGAGFIGKHLCRHLLSSGYRLTVFDNFSSSDRASFLAEFAGSLEIIEGSITDLLQISEAMDAVRPDVVIHLAACVSVQNSLKNPAQTFLVNVQGTKNVIEAGRQVSVKKIIFASSAAVYGDQKPPLSEERVIFNSQGYRNSLMSPYAVSKLEGEELISVSQIPYVIFRIFNVYGDGQKKGSGYAAIIPELVFRFKGNQEVVVFGDGTQTRDFVHVGDVVRSVSFALEKDSLSGIFNLATGIGIRILDLIRVFQEITGKDLKLKYESGREGDILESYADIDRFKSLFGFSPSTPLENGIRQLL